ncbi:MAG: NTP transferase domain-containing protein [Lachnospiraceae bacterium]|nr:NTP transferase domain-containing protein [Lachnospiraceae bacterium]
MQAVLLAGGLGTRLKSVVKDRPKPMALIEEKPFLGYVVRELSRQKIHEIVFAVGYKGSMVEDYFGDGSAFGVKVSYAYEEELLGTAGAIKNAGKLLKEDRFFVLNGDTFYQVDYGRLSKVVRERDLDLGLVLRPVPDVSRYGRAQLSGDMLVSFNEKQAAAEPGTINGGIYLMDRKLLEEIPEGKVSLENDMIPRWMKEGRRLGGLVGDGYFIDIGIPEDYLRFQKDVKEGIVRW